MKKLRPRPMKDSFTDDLKLLQRLSISLCNPCTPQNTNSETIIIHDTNYTKMLSKTINSTNEETFVSSLMTPIIPTSSKVDDFEASSDEEFVIERGHTVVDLCSDTSLDNVNSISQLQSTVKLSGKKNVRKRELSKSNRDRVSSDMFKSFNEMVFNNKLPEMLPISWNSRLLKTAGLTHCKETVEAKNRAITRHASIEISVKVLNSIKIIAICLD